MTDRIEKNELIRRLAARMKTDEQIAAVWVDAIVETLYEAFKAGKSVTLSGFGSFYRHIVECIRRIEENVAGERDQFILYKSYSNYSCLKLYLH